MLSLVRKRVIFFVLLSVGLLLVVLLFRWLSTDSSAPRLISAKTEARLGSFRRIHYDAFAEQPFAHGKVWITTLSGTNQLRCFLLDLEARKILNELKNASPVCFTSDQSKLVCHQFLSLQKFRSKLWQVIDRVTFGSLHLSTPPVYTEVFWLLDFKGSSPTLLGRVVQQPGLVTPFQPSPDFHYGFIKPLPSYQTHNLFVCDLQKETFAPISLDGDPMTWWNQQSILLRGTNGDFKVYHVPTGTVSNLITTTALTKFFEILGDREANPGNASIFTVWTGKERTFISQDSMLTGRTEPHTWRGWSSQPSNLL